MRHSIIVTNMNIRYSNRAIHILLFILSILFVSCKKDKPIDEEPLVDKKRAYISKIYEYKPAPGQFINDNSYGTLSKAAELVGGVDRGLISLGGFGGYVIFGFDHAIENKAGYDLGIYGNPLIGVGMEWSEPGIVCVMQDLNKNGLPDDGEWYELAGSEHEASQTIKNYVITYFKPATATEDIRWTDNLGNVGYILKNQYHNQNYYPSWFAGDQVQFKGTLLKNTLGINGGLVFNQPFSFGYADNGSANYLKIQSELGRGYNVFDIDWAINSSGNKVVLTHIDFIKVYTAQNSNGNPYHPDYTHSQARSMGEVSTEMGGAIDLHFK